MSRFSEFFSLLIQHNTSITKTALCEIFFEWNGTRRSINYYSRFYNSEKPIPPSLYEDLDREPNSLSTISASIQASYVKGIDNTSSLTTDLLTLLHGFSIPESEENYINNDIAQDLPLLITCVFYLAATERSQLPPELTPKTKNELVSEEEQVHFQSIIWNASQQSYFYSHRKGNRFGSLHIIERLLPKGYIEPSLMNFHFDSSNEKLRNIDDIYNSTNDHIAITGEGGIGKTTFLQVLLERAFGNEETPKPYSPESVIPVFIELNLCPKNVNTWYKDRYHRTNFITRYIADLIQCSPTKYRNYNMLLESIEQEFQNQSDGTRKYLLLLDGFNEVSTDTTSTGESVRTILSHEISELRNLPNIRIITTSRVTRSAFYTSGFTRVHLNGLTDDDIQNHLLERNYPKTEIQQILSNGSLKKCLTIPLFLCMFSSKSEYNKSIMPETHGEILYNFFHESDSVYNLKKRAIDAYNNPLQHIPYATEFVLDFIVPYIGWRYTQLDSFSVSSQELSRCIQDSINNVLLLNLPDDNLPFPEFESSGSILRDIAERLNNSEHHPAILSCIIDYLSILYSFQTNSNVRVKTKRYSFVHHYFRDYFSAIWSINLLWLFPYNYQKSLFDSTYAAIGKNHWNESEATIIGQILQEHRNTPVLNSHTKNWEIPPAKSDRQTLLNSVLDYCRKPMTGYNSDRGIFLQNIISTLKICRGELSGICLDKLNLSKCNIHNITCSKKGKSSVLATSFKDSYVTEDTFSPTDHLDLVTEYLYSKNACFTLDQDTTLNIWETVSNSRIVHVHIEAEPSEVFEFTNTPHMYISPNKTMLSIRMCTIHNGRNEAFIYLLYLHDLGTYRYIKLPNHHRIINDICFSSDSEQIVILADNNTLYTVDLANDEYGYSIIHPETIEKSDEASFISEMNIGFSDQGDLPTLNAEYCSRVINLFNHARIFVGSNNDEVFLFTYQLDIEDIENTYYDDEYESDDSIDEEPPELTPCIIIRYNISSKETEYIYSFKSAAYTSPSFTYIQEINRFLIYDAESEELKLVDCETKDAIPVLSQILEENDYEMPSTFHVDSNGGNSIYIMYPQACYQVEVSNSGNTQITEKYEVPTIESVSADFTSNELSFVVNTAPSNNRLLLWNDDHETYEWHTESGEIQYKYNPRIYDTVALIPDHSRLLFMLIHAKNGISIFSQDNYKLINSYCFTDNDYRIEGARYSTANGNLFLLFERGQHNFIRRINIDTSESEIIYSDQRPSDGNTKLSISPDGNHLLITTVAYCEEYSLAERSLHTVYKANDNEWLTTAYYVDEQIHIGIAMARSYLKPSFNPRCEIYERANKGYSFNYGYYIPTLTKRLSSKFVHENKDYGSPCCYKPNALQNYYITRGFFISDDEDIQDFLTLSKITKRGKRIVTDGTLRLAPFDFIQVRHRSPIDNRNIIGGTQHSYSYLSSDFSEAMFIHDYQIITYWKNLKKNPTDYITFDYRNEFNDVSSASWDFAIPVCNDHFICCTDSYRLFPVDAKTGSFEEEICYEPGLAICGCRFYLVQASEECEKLISENGGLL